LRKYGTNVRASLKGEVKINFPLLRKETSRKTPDE
jgi:hypothetical protein